METTSTCEGCGDLFTYIKCRRHRFYCSQPCRARANRRRNKDRISELKKRDYAANPGPVRERSKKWHHANRERASEQHRSWRAANVEYCRKKQMEWRDANPDRIQQWKDANPEKLRAASSRRRAKKRSVMSEKFDHEEIFERDGWTCRLCFLQVDSACEWPDPMSPQIDHIVPLDPGSRTRDNVQCSHMRCNSSKKRNSIAGMTREQLIAEYRV